MKTLIFEIGVEEMPAAAAEFGVAKIKSETEELLHAFRLLESGSSTTVESYGTPRRLILIVRGLPEKQASAVAEIKGPPKRVAFTQDGSPAPAAVGFAKNQGVEVGELQIREADGGEYLFAVKQHPGLPTFEILPEILGTLLKSLEFTKSMRWGGGQVRFIRPVRWLLALFGADEISIELEGLKSGRLTYGHRFLVDEPIEIEDADDYLKKIGEAKVVIDAQTRSETISRLIETEAEKAGGRAAINPKVLGEVAYLVEDPHVVVGTFDEEFLKIPRAATVTAMEAHQRYFPVEGSDGNLLPLFIVAHNGDPQYGDQIARGHERVLRARLADAAFFFHEDSRTTLESKVDRLKSVVWQAKLGTVFSKV